MVHGDPPSCLVVGAYSNTICQEASPMPHSVNDSSRGSDPLSKIFSRAITPHCDNPSLFGAKRPLQSTLHRPDSVRIGGRSHRSCSILWHGCIPLALQVVETPQIDMGPGDDA